MKRIVVLIDGTWNDERRGDDTNVAKLDPGNKGALKRLILAKSAAGTLQLCHYHDGVGTQGGFLDRILGGSIGLGLKKIVQDCYSFVVANYEADDEIYVFGFSRGAYAARALTGLIGASGIQRQANPQEFEIAWSHYRVPPAVRKAQTEADATDHVVIQRYRSLVDRNAFHGDRSVKCVAVWDTVGSYGVPTGFGFAPLARYITLLFLGFHDTRFGDHVDVGLHAVAIDERRRPFVPTFWTIPKGQQPRGHVEQTWFAGVHCSVGGGYADAGLSDQALIWMIARVQALTGLEFDSTAVKATTNPNIDGEVVNSSKGWPISQLLPYKRVILSPDAIHHGIFLNTMNPAEERINERVHWSVLAKRGRPCTYYGKPNTPYAPPNLPSNIPGQKVATITPEERAMLP
jgi:uncharacterized protein (DUF2235 family)